CGSSRSIWTATFRHRDFCRSRRSGTGSRATEERTMSILIALAGLALILFVLFEAFETVVLPRRVAHPFRFTRFYYRNMWNCWRAVALLMHPGKRREAFLSWFGPLSLLGLFGAWFVGLILGFGILGWGLGLPVQTVDAQNDLGTYLYFSGVTFFTLGFGDVI